MHKTLLTTLAVLFPLLAVGQADAQTTCPNQSSTATIPMTGENDVTVYDKDTCSALAGPFTITVGTFGPTLNATTKPAVTVDPLTSLTPGLLRFTANGAPFGTRVTASVTFSPDTTKSQSIVLTVGGSVSGLVFGTSAP